MPHDTLEQTLAVLSLVKHCVSFSTAKLFRTPGNQTNVEKLYYFLKSCDLNKGPSKIQQEIFQQLPEIDEHDWASVCKEFVKSCKLVNDDSLNQTFILRNFFIKLNRLSASHSHFNKLAQDALLEYLQFLLNNACYQNVKIIHQYLHFAHLIWRFNFQAYTDKTSEPFERDYDKTEGIANKLAAEISPVMGVCLFDALDLTQHFSSSNDLLAKANALKFMNHLMACFLQLPVFQIPFSEDIQYANVNDSVISNNVQNIKKILQESFLDANVEDFMSHKKTLCLKETASTEKITELTSPFSEPELGLYSVLHAPGTRTRKPNGFLKKFKKKSEEKLTGDPQSTSPSPRNRDAKQLIVKLRPKRRRSFNLPMIALDIKSEAPYENMQNASGVELEPPPENRQLDPQRAYTPGFNAADMPNVVIPKTTESSSNLLTRTTSSFFAKKK